MREELVCKSSAALADSKASESFEFFKDPDKCLNRENVVDFHSLERNDLQIMGLIEDEGFEELLIDPLTA